MVCGVAGAVETEEFVLVYWEKKKGKIERNKNKNFYLLNINYITLTSNMDPGQVGALGRCPSFPGSGPGLSPSPSPPYPGLAL